MVGNAPDKTNKPAPQLFRSPKVNQSKEAKIAHMPRFSSFTLGHFLKLEVLILTTCLVKYRPPPPGFEVEKGTKLLKLIPTKINPNVNLENSC